MTAVITETRWRCADCEGPPTIKPVVSERDWIAECRAGSLGRIRSRWPRRREGSRAWQACLREQLRDEVARLRQLGPGPVEAHGARLVPETWWGPR